MKFFSGFGFEKEYELFDYIKLNSFDVAGFSFGAIKAYEYSLDSDKRIDRLILISPAFFQDRDEKFKKLQLIFYKKDKKNYLENFYKNVIYPSNLDIEKYKKEYDIDNLKKLLYFFWDEKKLEKILEKGIEIEVYLGEKDKIIDSQKAYEFFKNFGTVYFIKGVGHLLI